MSLDGYTDAELSSELTRRALVAAEERERERRRRILVLSEILEMPGAASLLRFILPEHSRNTCAGDDDIVNDGRCTRCTILQAVAVGDLDVLLGMRVSL